MQILGCQSLAFRGVDVPKKTEKTTVKKQETEKPEVMPASDIPRYVLVANGFKIRTMPDVIEFTPAKTIEEARKFAMENLLIYRYELTDVDCANYVNEALSEYYNKHDINRTVVKTVDTMQDKKDLALMNCFTWGLSINENEFKNIDNYIEKSLNNETIKERWQNADKDCDLSENQRKYFEFCKEGAKNFRELPLKERIGLMLFLRGFSGERATNDNGKIALPDGGPFWIINHEIGHEEHCESIGIPKYRDLNMSYKKDMPREEAKAKFKEAEPKWEATLKVSDYASSRPVEFVAEVFACLQNGVKFDDDVMELYEKYGGPKTGPNVA